jgi:hypothetical protein
MQLATGSAQEHDALSENKEGQGVKEVELPPPLPMKKLIFH